MVSPGTDEVSTTVQRSLDGWVGRTPAGGSSPKLKSSRPGFFPCGPPTIPIVSSSQIQTRNIRHLPDILVINCEVNSLKEADFWRMQAEVRT